MKNSVHGLNYNKKLKKKKIQEKLYDNSLKL